MQEILLNERGSHTLNITEQHLQTIHKYSLFQDLIDSNGYIDDSVLDKLKYNIRSIIDRSNEEDKVELLDLCHDVIFAPKMKAYGLHQLIMLYIEWKG